MFPSSLKDRNKDRQFRLMFWSRWRSFDPADDLELTAIVHRRSGASSEHAGKRLTKLQCRPRVFRRDISEIAHV